MHPYKPNGLVERYQYNTEKLLPSLDKLHTTPPKLTTTLWEDEGTICYQVDAKSICVARRQDNDMINGTKLLNVVGLSRGRRDGILKNERGRVVVKVGAMHLKGVWIPFASAKNLATQFKIHDYLYPLFVDDPSCFLVYNNQRATHMIQQYNSIRPESGLFHIPPIQHQGSSYTSTMGHNAYDGHKLPFPLPSELDTSTPRHNITMPQRRDYLASTVLRFHHDMTPRSLREQDK